MYDIKRHVRKSNLCTVGKGQTCFQLCDAKLRLRLNTTRYLILA